MKKGRYKKQLEKVLRLIIDHNLVSPHNITRAAGKILDADKEFKKLKGLK